MSAKVTWPGGFLGLMVALMFGLPWLLGVDPNALSEDQFAGVSRAHWLGTDGNGRDLLVGFAGAGVSLVIGVGWGLVAGYLGGRWDAWMMRVVDILFSLPSILFVIVLGTALQEPVVRALESLGGRRAAALAPVLFLVLGLGGVSWLTMARIVRGQVLSLRNQPFIEAARVLGAGPGRVVVRHLLPNLTGIVMAYLTLTIPSIVLGESFLSFLGLGIQPPHASLGTLMADGAGRINPLRMAWAPLLGPGGVLVGLLMLLGFLGDGFREWLDPRRDR